MKKLFCEIIIPPKQILLKSKALQIDCIIDQSDVCYHENTEPRTGIYDLFSLAGTGLFNEIMYYPVDGTVNYSREGKRKINLSGWIDVLAYDEVMDYFRDDASYWQEAFEGKLFYEYIFAPKKIFLKSEALQMEHTIDQSESSNSDCATAITGIDSLFILAETGIFEEISYYPEDNTINYYRKDGKRIDLSGWISIFDYEQGGDYSAADMVYRRKAACKISGKLRDDIDLEGADDTE